MTGIGDGDNTGFNVSILGSIIKALISRKEENERKNKAGRRDKKEEGGILGF